VTESGTNCPAEVAQFQTWSNPETPLSINHTTIVVHSSLQQGFFHSLRKLSQQFRWLQIRFFYRYTPFLTTPGGVFSCLFCCLFALRTTPLAKLAPLPIPVIDEAGLGWCVLRLCNRLPREAEPQTATLSRTAHMSGPPAADSLQKIRLNS
jgi:hypothetical protein